MSRPLIGLSLRLMPHPRYDELMETIDVRWYNLFIHLGVAPVLLPNSLELLPEVCVQSLLKGVILTGGNNLSAYETNAAAQTISQRRDACETFLLRYCIEQQIPVLGVCRGMQLINQFYGGHLLPITGHSAVRHPIEFAEGVVKQQRVNVNSYHNFAIARNTLGSGLQVVAKDNDGHVEAFQHRTQAVYGMMWHPEREDQPSPIDIDWIKRIFVL